MSETSMGGVVAGRRRGRLDYRAVWRWHFYAGLFCIPFVMWLAATGCIYLFKPQIEAWLDRSYDHLAVSGPAAAPSMHVAAALAAVPGGTLNSYDVPRSADASVRVLVGRGPELYRVYVRPDTAMVLNVAREDQKIMRRLFYLHGELASGAKGSMLVELAASWAVVMMLTGLFLWWPRKHRGFGGVIYPRLFRGGRVFWRDLHAVTALWVSFFALFLIASGLPWAKSWGNLLKTARSVGGVAAARLDWTTGSDVDLAERIAMNTPATEDEHAMHRAAAAAPDDHAMHGAAAAGTVPVTAAGTYAALDRMVPTMAALHLAPPVLISPPSKAARTWTARSDSPNRMQRTVIVLDATTGGIVSRTNFGERPLVDRLVGIGVSAHEGQLFGILNQLIGLFTAIGLETVCVSAIVLWWRRRPAATLGALAALPQSRVPAFVFAIVVVLGLIFPMLGVSLIAVLVMEQALFRQVVLVRDFLGLD